MRDREQGGLREIRFNPEGNLWVTTGNLGSVPLGQEDGQLDRRLMALLHLNKDLPKKLGQQRPAIVDLTDPEQPELSVGSPPPPANNSPSPKSTGPTPIPHPGVSGTAPGATPGTVAVPAVPLRGAQ